MSDKSLFIAASVAAGAILPLQALINARLGASVGGPAVAATISVGIGTLAMMAFLTAVRAPLPASTDLVGLPWWIWLGGLLGAFYVAMAAYAAPAIGAASMIALVVLGQMSASLVLDHFGVLNTAQPINWQRILGALLLLAGVWLITRPNLPAEGSL